MSKINSYKDLKVCRDLNSFQHRGRQSSLGSQAEVETVLEVIRRRKLIPIALVTKGLDLAETVGQMLYGLVRSLEQ